MCARPLGAGVLVSAGLLALPLLGEAPPAVAAAAGRVGSAGGAARALLAGQALSPWAMDALLARAGFALQRTREPKTNEDALFEPLEGLDEAEGGSDAWRSGTAPTPGR